MRIISAVILAWFISSSAYASNVPQTGQTATYSNGDDGSLQKGVDWPVPRFTDNGDGTVTDRLTQLIWLKNGSCFESQNWSNALMQASSLSTGNCDLTDGSSEADWRLPNVRELESILHMGFSNPMVPNVQGTGKASEGNPFNDLKTNYYWSSTSDVNDPSLAFAVDLGYGLKTTTPKTGLRYALFVKAGSGTAAAKPYATAQNQCFTNSGVNTGCAGTGQDGELQKGTVWPNPRFTDNGDGTLYDNLTNLTWLKNGNCFLSKTWTNAINEIDSLADGSCGLTDNSRSGDWRLPNRNELSSLISYKYSFPALPDTSGTGQWSSGDPFTNIQADSAYWTSTTASSNTSLAPYVELYRGTISYHEKQFTAFVLPVRGEKVDVLSVNIDGTGQVTSTPTGISCPGVCSSTFLRDSNVILKATPDAGSRFTGWSDVSCGMSTTCTIRLSSSTSITANFTSSGGAVAPWLILLMD